MTTLVQVVLLALTVPIVLIGALWVAAYVVILARLER